MSSTKRFATIAAAALMGLVASKTQADTLTVNSFGATNDGSSGWTAGHFETGLIASSFSAYNVSSTSIGGYTGLNEYSTGAVDPNVIVNTSSSDYLIPAANEVFQANTVNLGPYLGPSVVQYNVSSAGYYDISSTFQTVQTVNEYPTAYLYVNGAVVSSQSLTGAAGAQYGNSVSLDDDNVKLSAGDKIDFVVWGADLNNKTTQLHAAVTQGVSASTPLPASAGVGFSMLGLFGGLAVLRKRLTANSRIA